MDGNLQLKGLLEHLITLATAVSNFTFNSQQILTIFDRKSDKETESYVVITDDMRFLHSFCRKIDG